MQLEWPVAFDQVALLQLLSSHATQEFRYFGDSETVDFTDAEGKPFVVYDNEIISVSNILLLLLLYMIVIALKIDGIVFLFF